MKHSHHTEQKDLNAGTFTLRNLSAQFLEQAFDVRPSNIGRDRPSVDQFDGALMFAFHGNIVPIISINNKNQGLVDNRQRRRLYTTSAHLLKEQRVGGSSPSGSGLGNQWTIKKP
jgi:hypothetical protein